MLCGLYPTLHLARALIGSSFLASHAHAVLQALLAHARGVALRVSAVLLFAAARGPGPRLL